MESSIKLTVNINPEIVKTEKKLKGTWLSYFCFAVLIDQPSHNGDDQSKLFCSVLAVQRKKRKNSTVSNPKTGASGCVDDETVLPTEIL